MKIDKLGKELSLLATVIFGLLTSFLLGNYRIAKHVHMTLIDYYLVMALILFAFTTFFFGLSFFTELKEN